MEAAPPWARLRAARDDYRRLLTEKMRAPDGGYEEADSFLMPKGSCVHVPIEAFNLDREVWGADGWQFK